MRLPILYSRNATGTINTWEIEVDGNRYRTTSGNINGVKTTSEWKICFSKNIGKVNYTSSEEQAVVEAKAKWEKKKKEKYFENVNDVDFQNFIKPMLAKDLKSRLDKIRYPVYVDIKYNGMRCIVSKDGMFTRKGEKIISAPHIFEFLNPVFEKYPNAVFDGELYNHEYRYKLNEIISLVRKTVHVSEDNLKDSKNKVFYYIYDGYGFDNITENSLFLERRTGLSRILSNVPHVIPVWHRTAKKESEIWEAYNSYVQDGYEGAIIRLNGKYEHKRSSNLLKCKPVDDAEFEIVDIIEGEGNRSGMAGKVVCKMKDGRIFGASMKGSETQFIEVLKNKQRYIGKVATIYFNGFTGLGVPSFAQFDCNNWNKGDR